MTKIVYDKYNVVCSTFYEIILKQTIISVSIKNIVCVSFINVVVGIWYYDNQRESKYFISISL